MAADLEPRLTPKLGIYKLEYLRADFLKMKKRRRRTSRPIRLVTKLTGIPP